MQAKWLYLPPVLEQYLRFFYLIFPRWRALRTSASTVNPLFLVTPAANSWNTFRGLGTTLPVARFRKRWWIWAEWSRTVLNLPADTKNKRNTVTIMNMSTALPADTKNKRNPISIMNMSRMITNCFKSSSWHQKQKEHSYYNGYEQDDHKLF